MTDPLHARLPVTSLANDCEVIEISAEIGGFSRLAETLAADLSVLDAAQVPRDWRARPVSGRLQFGTDTAGGAVAAVELKAGITSVCQRCLDVFEWSLQTELKLQLIAAEEVADELEGYEVWELDEDAIVPAELVDEALVMALPLSARHDENCVEVEAEEVTDKLTTPFADLRSQMDKTTD